MERSIVTKEAARRMRTALKQHIGQGGWLLFGLDGDGGAWYSDNAHPTMAETDIQYAVPQSEYDLGTVEEVQKWAQQWIDQRAEDREQAETDRQAGY